MRIIALVLILLNCSAIRISAQQLNIQYASYFGGSGEDYPSQCIQDESSNTYLVGRTESNDFPATLGAYQEVYGGGDSDGFVMKFNADHSLAWATYIGGNAEDGLFEVVIINDVIYAIGYTFSNNGISTGSAGNSQLTGFSDGIITAMNTSGQVLWCGYFGGNGSDFLHSIIGDSQGNIYIAGKTQSTSGIASTDAHQTTLAGTVDGWLAKMNSNGEIVWSTYFGGSGIDYINSLVATSEGNLACVGVTASEDFETSANAHQLSLSNNNDAFMSIFNSSGVLGYSTYIGGNMNDSFTKVSSFQGKVIAIGNTGSTEGLISGDSPYQSTFGGSIQDGFIFEFDELSASANTSYIGGDGYDECQGICVSQDQLWIAMSTTSANLPYDDSIENNGWGMSDAYIISFDGNFNRLFSGYIRGIYPDNAKTITVDNEIKLFGNNYILEDYTTIDAFQSQPVGLGDVLFSVFSNPVQVTEIDGEQSFLLYPNPCSSTIHMHVPKDNCNYIILDSMGRTIHVEVQKNQNLLNLDTSHLSPGFYFIHCISEQRHKTVPFIKE